eukprot:423972_1
MILFILFLSCYTSMIKAYIVYYDSMDNVKSTGWSSSIHVTNSYWYGCENDAKFFSPANSGYCPSGTCTFMVNWKIQKTFSNIETLTSLHIAFDVFGIDQHYWVPGVSLFYKYNNQDSFSRLIDTSPTGAESIELEVPESVGATSITFKFTTFCLGTKNICDKCGAVYIDNFYFMATSSAPTKFPTNIPTTSPTRNPSSVTNNPTKRPTDSPTTSPTNNPTFSPTSFPSSSPSAPPTQSPTVPPTAAPSNVPTTITYDPTIAPSLVPSINPTQFPSIAPSSAPSNAPTNNPSITPSNNPTIAPSVAPSSNPTYINDIEYGICVELINYENILYDISQP